MVGGLVEDGIERWIVIHLELKIEFKPATAVQDVGPQLGEAESQVVALLLEELETLLVAVTMVGGCIGTLCLFMRMEDLERKDRKAVEDEAGSLRVKGSHWYR